MKSVVIVTDERLNPITGGGASRICRIIRQVRKAGYVTHLVTPDAGDGYAARLSSLADRVWLFGGDTGFGAREHLGSFAKRYLPQSVSSMLRSRFAKSFAKSASHGTRASFIGRKMNPGLCRLAARVAHREKPIAVIAQFVWLARALDHLPPRTLRILDTIDVQHLRKAKAEQAGGDLRYYQCTREEEVRELRRSDVIIAIQFHEQQILRELCPDRHVILTEHSVSDPRPLLSPDDSRMVLLVGNLYDPNILGLRQFMAESWPAIRTAVPDARLVVCGRVCDAFDGAADGVEFAGVVPDLELFYRQAAVVINPVPYGSGLKIKSVEALSFGKCIVGTPCAFYGMEDTLDPPYVVSQSPAGMANAVIQFLRDSSLRRDRERETWAWVRRRFEPDSVYSDLECVLRNHISYIRSEG